MQFLTQAQEKVYGFILEREEDGKSPPTIREIAEATEMSSALAYRRVLALEKRGLIERGVQGTHRNIKIRLRI